MSNNEKVICLDAKALLNVLKEARRHGAAWGHVAITVAQDMTEVEYFVASSNTVCHWIPNQYAHPDVLPRPATRSCGPDTIEKMCEDLARFSSGDRVYYGSNTEYGEGLFGLWVGSTVYPMFTPYARPGIVAAESFIVERQKLIAGIDRGYTMFDPYLMMHKPGPSYYDDEFIVIDRAVQEFGQPERTGRRFRLDPARLIEFLKGSNETWIDVRLRDKATERIFSSRTLTDLIFIDRSRSMMFKVEFGY